MPFIQSTSPDSIQYIYDHDERLLHPILVAIQSGRVVDLQRAIQTPEPVRIENDDGTAMNSSPLSHAGQLFLRQVDSVHGYYNVQNIVEIALSKNHYSLIAYLLNNRDILGLSKTDFISAVEKAHGKYAYIDLKHVLEVHPGVIDTYNATVDVNKQYKPLPEPSEPRPVVSEYTMLTI
ncbi:MAG: hypothetical protein P1U61_01535 [Legionellaceae bacterium]|nr:hypothetical protein [Legionellaceae bacterium]